MDDIKKDPFEEYIRNLPPSKKEIGQAWSAAIGLQDVDGLKTSEYLLDTAKKNITVFGTEKCNSPYRVKKERRMDYQLLKKVYVRY